MKTEIQIFSNPQLGEVRAIELTNEPMFAATDVCRILGYSNTSKAINDHTEFDERYNKSLERGGSMLFINESGLYSLIIRSNKEEAKRFKKWVTSEVLPSIRKTGGYIATSENDTPETIMAKALLIADETIKRQTKQLEEQRPKVLFAEAVETSNRSCLIAELAKIIKQNGIDIGQNRLFDWLRNNGFLCRYGESFNQPTQKAMDLGLFEIKKTTITKPDGTILVNTTPKVMGKGQVYFVNKFLYKKHRGQK